MPDVTMGSRSSPRRLTGRRFQSDWYRASAVGPRPGRHALRTSGHEALVRPVRPLRQARGKR
jgi:hypothetical protein